MKFTVTAFATLLASATAEIYLKEQFNDEVRASFELPWIFYVECQ